MWTQNSIKVNNVNYTQNMLLEIQLLARLADKMLKDGAWERSEYLQQGLKHFEDLYNVFRSFILHLPLLSLHGKHGLI